MPEQARERVLLEGALALVITHLSVYMLRNLSLEERERLGCVVLVMRGWPRGIRHSYAGRTIVDYWLKEAGP